MIKINHLFVRQRLPPFGHPSNKNAQFRCFNSTEGCLWNFNNTHFFRLRIAGGSMTTFTQVRGIRRKPLSSGDSGDARKSEKDSSNKNKEETMNDQQQEKEETAEDWAKKRGMGGPGWTWSSFSFPGGAESADKIERVRQAFESFRMEQIKKAFKEGLAEDKMKVSDMRSSVNEFNKQYAEKFGFEGVWDEQRSRKVGQWLKIMPFALPFIVYLVWYLRPRSKISPEHAEIFAKPKISLEQFISDFLSTGEVHTIFSYPIQREAIAIIHPGAMVKGEPFMDTAVHFGFGNFSYLREFVQKIRDAENQIGVDQREAVPIYVRGTPTASLLFYVLGTGMLFIFAARYLRFHIARQTVIFKPINGSAAGGKQRHKPTPNGGEPSSSSGTGAKD